MTDRQIQAVAEILPCPFCGERAEIHDKQGLDYGSYIYYIKCSGCYAQSGTDYAGFKDNHELPVQRLRKAWNTRAAKAAIEASDAKHLLILADALRRAELELRCYKPINPQSNTTSPLTELHIALETALANLPEEYR